MHTVLKIVLSASVIAILVSCGGGGSGDGATTTDSLGNWGWAPQPGTPEYTQFEVDVRTYVDQVNSSGGTPAYEETGATSKDLAKIQGMKQSAQIDRAAKSISLEFGLSQERSRELARISVKLANSPKRGMTPADYSALSKEVFGSSAEAINTAMAKAAQGDSEELNQVIERAAVVNGIGPEHARDILSQLINNY
ncbi:MAG TPA: hypothetical protein VM432_03140 [Bdellovibrionales bacterium]|nr:hypothetical protein [Bdellovibrionales bacterium]